MGCFSRSSPARGHGPCVACCQAHHAKDDQLSTASSARIAALDGRRGPIDGAPTPAVASGSPSGRADSDCARQARALAPVVARFDRYRQALPSARATADLNELGDKPGDEPSTKPCLTRLPVDAEKLNAALGLPAGKLQPQDLRNDQTGFRAAVYRDEETGRLILVPRDTEPDTLSDWETNTRNGLGQDTPQYSAMRALTGRLRAGPQQFDIAGYSKGGGLAQEGGLVNTLAQVRLFNSAGEPDGALSRTGQASFDDLVSRTTAFSSEGEIVTFMNATTDPGQNIINSRFLQRELAGRGPGLNPIELKVRNPAMRGAVDPPFAGDRQSYLDELMGHIQEMQTAYDTGGTVAAFPPVRAASRETIPGSMTPMGRLLGAGDDQPNLGKLAQHKMAVVLGSMESDVAADRQALSRFLASCG
jgi:hypothetical protein